MDVTHSGSLLRVPVLERVHKLQVLWLMLV